MLVLFWLGCVLIGCSDRTSSRLVCTIRTPEMIFYLDTSVKLSSCGRTIALPISPSHERRLREDVLVASSNLGLVPACRAVLCLGLARLR
ncbi:hypothetical protein BKA93DRAFT_623303 [Sparassis latifolia]